MNTQKKNLHSEIIPDPILAFAFKKLDALKVGDVILVADAAKTDPELFIRCCDQYHQCYGNLELKSDRTEIRKVLTFTEQLEKFK